MKFLITFIAALAFNLLASIGIGTAADIPVEGVFAVLSVASLIPKPVGLLAGVYKETWTGEMVKRFTSGVASFLKGIRSYNHLVENDVIHLTEIGSLPDVLTNNTSYPLVPQALAETDIPISLDKLETVPISITADELHGITYPKIKVSHELHREALDAQASRASAHAFAPDADTADSPIVKTGGSDNGDGYNSIRVADIIALKKKFDDVKMPKSNRVLVLSSDHVNELLLTDETFKAQYINIAKGEVLPMMFGFEIHEYTENPVYNAAFEKVALGTAPAGTDRVSSFAYWKPYMWQATGSIEVFLSEAKKDVLNKRNLSSFNVYHKARPKILNYAIGAIVSESVA